MKENNYEELNYQQVNQLLKVIQNKKDKATIAKKLIEIEINSLNSQISEIDEFLNNKYFDVGLGEWVVINEWVIEDDEDIVITLGDNNENN